jgi:AraC-like DNA-binding protein
MKPKEISTESIEEFLRHKVKWLPPDLQKDIGHFNVFRLEDCIGTDKAPKYSRRDFYKISFMTGNHRYHYGDKTLETSGNTLMFFNPSVPYIFEQQSDNPTGFFCIFKESFFTEHLRTRIKDLPMFMPGHKPSYALTQQQSKDVSNVFKKMLDEIGSDYQYKYDLIRNYIMEIVHYALKIQPVEHLYPNGDANARITAVFTELLERQFPIESPAQRFSLRSPKDFAEQLSIHVNHLNRALRSATGKTTSEHIFERLIAEAVALLKHTDWNISEISYCLGFEEPSHFNNFFKKHTSFTPSALRA